MTSSQETVKEFLDESITNCQIKDKKDFSKVTLAYLTPWNKGGEEFALKNAKVIDIVSPCWFELKPETLNGKFNIKIEGSDYVNDDFLIKIREENNKIKIVPRFNCQSFSVEHFTELYKADNTIQFLKVLMRRLKYNKFNGIVLECNQVWLIDKFFPNFTEFARKLSEELKKENMLFISVIFPYSDNIQNFLSKQRFEYLSRYVDYFNMMTYDYVTHLSEKKQADFKLNLAPISWINKSIDHYIDAKRPNKDALYKKILLGIPFHGFVVEKSTDKPKGFPIDGAKFVKILDVNKDGRIKWEEEEKEHIIDFSEHDKLYTAAYPTKRFIKERIALADKANLGGVGVWDIAQGLECYFDQF